MTSRAGELSARSSVLRVRRQRAIATGLGAVVIFFLGVMALVFANFGSQGSGIALLVLLGAIGAAALRPIAGVFAIVFLGLMGDGETSAWFPFAKNLSSKESLLYVSDGLPLSPLEILVVITVLLWLIELFSTPGGRLVKDSLLTATAAFTGFVVLGFVVGIAGGGDIRVALFEGRAMLVLFPMYLLIINLCDRRALRALAWTAIAAIFVNALFALLYLRQLSPQKLEGLEALGDHTAATHWNMIIVLTLVLFLYRAGSRSSRFVMLGLCVPTLIVYSAAQRRSAVIGLVVALGIVVLALWWRDRAKFLVIAPVLLLLGVGYTAAFWNSTSSAGFPAQAVKSVISSTEPTEKDRSSDQYRDMENFDINYTIRSAPVLGIGFGQKFYRPIPLPDISFFEFYEYIPHNSILWIWIKTGFGGFLSMLMMLGLAVRVGARNLVNARDDTDAAFALVGVAFVFMFAVFAYVDIAWNSQNMVLLAVAFALCSSKVARTAPRAASASVERPLTKAR